MRVTLTTAICGVGAVGLTLDDARGADWIARGLAVEAVEKAEAVEPAPAPVAEPRPPPAPVPDFFAPEPPPPDVVPEVRSRRRR